MTEFIILSRADMLTLRDDKPVTVYVDKNPYVLCTDEYLKKQRIDVGDEVVGDFGVKGVVVGIDTCKGEVQLSLLMKNHKVPQLVKASRYKTKTGRHFPQITEVLEQIKGEADGE